MFPRFLRRESAGVERDFVDAALEAELAIAAPAATPRIAEGTARYILAAGDPREIRAKRYSQCAPEMV